MVGGRPRYVTALGETDESAGWRANKARGGILMDVASGEVITPGLSMPHSPRWYAGRLWVCESGAGTLGVIDPNPRKYVPIAEVPGFTRGVDFAGNLAFVGLSQVRASAVFSGIAITERLTEEQRTCGVCVIDLTTGQVIGLLRFETAVQEVFAVTVLPGRRYPELINDDNTLLETRSWCPRRHGPTCRRRWGAGRPGPGRGGVGRERERTTRCVPGGVRVDSLHQRLCETRGAKVMETRSRWRDRRGRRSIPDPHPGAARHPARVGPTTPKHFEAKHPTCPHLAVQYASFEPHLHGPPPLGRAAVGGIRRRSTARRRNQGRRRRDGCTKEAGGPTSTERGSGGPGSAGR
jgi:hypothetical protein